MAHLAKFKRNACGQMLSHYSRDKENFGNDLINLELTKKNYNLAPERNISDMEFLKQRISEVHCLKRKDVNVLCDWAITVPKDLPKEYHEEFFQESYNFLEAKYGKENVVSAYVHNDETTPHLHFAFIPIVQDKNKGHLKVSAKECITRADLKRFHPDLQQHLESKLKVPVNVLNEATKEGNKAIIELKRESAIERLDKANLQASKIVLQAKEQAQSIKDSLKALEAEFEALNAYIDEASRQSDISMMYPDYAKVETKGLLKKQKFVIVPADKWEAKHISANQIASLKQAREKLTSIDQDIERLKMQLDDERYNNLSLQQELEHKNDKILSLQHEINWTIKERNKLINQFNSLSPEIKKLVQQDLQKSHNKNIYQDRER